MSLPPWSFLVVGTGITLLSLKMVMDGQRMGIFIIVGIAMLAYGLIRMFLNRGAEKGKATHEPLVHGGMHVQHHTAAVHAHQIPRVCSSCGAKNNPRANYCGHCGNKIRE